MAIMDTAASRVMNNTARGPIFDLIKGAIEQLREAGADEAWNYVDNLPDDFFEIEVTVLRFLKVKVDIRSKVEMVVRTIVGNRPNPEPLRAA